MKIEKLELKSFKGSQGALLQVKGDDEIQVFVPAAVLGKAFITRAWLNRTLMQGAMCQRLFSAIVKNVNGQLTATEIWLAFEKNAADQTLQSFQNFGLELHKPALNRERTASKLINLADQENPIAKLATRFSNTGDLWQFLFDNEFLEKLDQRQQKNAAAVSNNRLLNLEMTPDWRVVTGLGEASVYETNITLHPVYGIPYIPASTLKGVLRHYFAENPPTDSALVETVFGLGDTDSASGRPVRGQATFFDAFPMKAPRIELDVMTPHYPKYYSDGLPPADWQSPNPVHFLTIGHGTAFRFLIGLPASDDAEAMQSNMENWLTEALLFGGLGAKSSVGYGSWTKIPAA